MTGKIVLEKSEAEAHVIANLKSNLTDTGDPEGIPVAHSPMEIATAVTLVVAISQVIMIHKFTYINILNLFLALI